MSVLGNFETKQAICETHGEYESIYFAKHWTGCPVCAEQSMAEKRAAQAIEDAAEYERQVKVARLEKVGFPRLFRNTSLNSYVVESREQERVVAACKRFVESFDANSGRGMIFIGELGNGKTHLGCAVLRALAIQGYSCKYTTEKAIGLRVKDSYRSREESELDIINSHVSPELLFVDEVGLSTGSDHDAALLNTVLTERYAESRGTIIATNLTAENLKAWIGERATDRLRQTSSVYMFNWESYRGRAQ